MVWVLLGKFWKTQNFWQTHFLPNDACSCNGNHFLATKLLIFNFFTQFELDKAFNDLRKDACLDE